MGKLPKIGLGLATLVLAITIYLDKVYFCGYSVFCYYLSTRVFDPLIYGMSALVLVFATLVLVPRAYEAWKKFAVWAIPLTALLFILAPEQSSGLGVVAFGPTPEQVFKWGSVLFVVVSLVIIVRAGLRKQ